MATTFRLSRDERDEYRNVRWGRVLGLTAAGAGIGAFSRVEFSMNPERLRYLHEPLLPRAIDGEILEASTKEWWKIAGRAPGKVRGSDLMLNALKWGEEQIFAVPRTFDLYSLASTGLTAPTGTPGRIVEQLPNTYVDAFQTYLEKELRLRDAQGQVRGLTAKEIAGGMSLREYQVGKDLFGRAKTEVGLFANLGPDNTPQMIMPHARLMSRYWAPPGVDPKYHHRSRLAATRQRIHGVRTVPAAFTTEHGVATGAVLSEHPFLVVGGQSKWHARARMGHAYATELSARYFRLLDDPIELIREYTGRVSETWDNILEKAHQNKVYGQLIMNRFGVGGPEGLEGANFTKLWGRHIKRILPTGLGLTASYYLTSAFTNMITGRTVGQIGASAVAHTQLTYNKFSDITGLTAISEWQREKAPGSTNLTALMAFPFSAYLTGGIAGSIWDRASTNDWAWRTARTRSHELPGFLSKLTGGRRVTRSSQWGVTAAFATAALMLPFLPGALGASQRTDELRAEMAGVKEVPIRKGRFWEMGRTPYQGGKTAYYRPHYYARSEIDAREIGVYGKYAGRPIARMFKSIADPYYLEKMHYRERPYPVTGPDDAGWGPLGPIWAATLGRLFKPERLMHTEEMGGGAGSYGGSGALLVADETEVSAELGGLGPGKARSPYDLDYQSGELAYRLEEAIGLPGFIFGGIKKALTGSSDFFDEADVLASATDIDSMRRGYWDLQLGGAGTASEAYRRFNPSKRFQVDYVNPLQNMMPSWMPGGDHYIDFRSGDPYAKVPEGELRLPGAGFASRYPELQGVDPEDYPLAYRYKVLSDVAPHSNEFRRVKDALKVEASMGNLTDVQSRVVAEAMRQEEERSAGRQFLARETTEGIMGSIWAAMVRIGRANPVEHLLPFSPVHKFAGETDVVTAYKDERVYSTDFPSWSRPLEHFVGPAVKSVGRVFGFTGIPGMEQERRDIQKYFDMLSYVKERYLESEFRKDGEARRAAQHGLAAERTKFGVDPYANKRMIDRVLDSRDREYLNAMMELQKPSEQRKALELVDDQTRELLLAAYNKDLYARLATQEEWSDEQKELMNYIEFARSTEGKEATKADWEQYVKAVSKGDWKSDDFADFLRMQEAQQYFTVNPLPDSDWIGWREDVEMEDVKLKFVMDEGRDFHDFGLWESQVKALGRKPYIIDAVREMRDATSGDARDRVWQMLRHTGHANIQISTRESPGDSAVIKIQQDNRAEIDAELKRMGLIN